jgi:MinD-like ATPase involved in chromosome partitioning or flagellar assembly
MDSEFMARYLREPQQGAELEPGRRGDDEPVAEPQPPAPSAIEEPGPPAGAAETDERTNVLPERESGAALPPGANEPGHPGPANRPAAPWERPPRTATPPPAGPPPREGMRPGAAEPASRSQGAASNHQERPRPGPGELRAAAAAPEDRPRWTLSPERTPATPAMSPWGHSPDAEHAPQWQAGQHLRVDELVKSRKLPPEMGWRKTVYTLTGHLVNLGAGPAERRLRDQIAAIGTNIPGNYQIGIVSVTGGIGKTRTSAGIGTAFALYRTEPVVAIDANPTYGNLGRLIDPHATASIREFMADTQMVTYPKARSYTGKNPKGLEVLAGNQNMANPLALSANLFTDTLSRTQRFYQLALIDCGPDIEHPVMEAVFSAVDALVIVGSMNFDGAVAAEQTIDWLATRNAHELLRRSVVVLNDVYHCQNEEFVTKVRDSLGPRVGAVKTIPWDVHLRDGAVLDFDALRRTTQLAYIDLAAWLAQGFTTAGAFAR